ncbi:hypothetical protein CFP56_012266 [Quercus suber]|uniref:Neprosin PEP catalytic domain-containing protein n=1 Tax=Quercus suber TaxID=58331 RepID=A0AAW0M702_QUESU
MASPCVRGRRWSRAVKMTLYLCFLIPMVAAGIGNTNTIFGQKQKLDIQRHPDGDIIDCVHIKNQPAFNHPVFRNHTIQMRPSFHPEGLSFDDVSSKSESEITQLWHLKGRCPEETIPIRRTKEASSVANYGRNKYPQFDTTDTNRTAFHENAIVFVTGDKYYGTKATINAWKPQVQEQVEFSISQLLILGGNAPAELNSIEAGWMVNYNVYGDYNSRLFAFFYTNKDTNQTRGCYNLLCSPGFVQNNKEIALGGSLNPISVYAGSQYELHFLNILPSYLHLSFKILQIDLHGMYNEVGHQRRGDWWLQVGKKYLMGHWPASLFVSLSESALEIQWGGEVTNLQKKWGAHHNTNGQRKASYFTNLQMVDGSNVLRFPNYSAIIARKPNCYNVTNFINNFYYGGPGRNPNCP